MARVCSKIMSEHPISISNLNDFIFCPVSIYFHAIDSDADSIMSQCESQINGTSAHDAVDNCRYSNKQTVLQAVTVYCDEYNIFGKIDLFDISNGILTERKKKIKNIYDGYIFQVYAQYFALCEMGYDVKTIRLYSMDDNKVYPVLLPKENERMLQKFEKLLYDINHFNLSEFQQTNPLKCKQCIYEPLCSFLIL